MEYDMDELVARIEKIEAIQIALLRALHYKVDEDPEGRYVKLACMWGSRE